MRTPLVFLVAAATAEAAPLELHHQGRLLDASGTPIAGDHTVRLTLYDGSGTAVWQKSYSNVPFTDGYFGVSLGTDDTARTIESATRRTNPAATVGVALDGAAELSPRTPLGATPRAAVAEAVPVAAGLTGSACSGDGALAVDSSGPNLVFCFSGTWRGSGTGPKSIATFNGVRQWSDGTSAASCKEYRTPTNPNYQYAGTTGNGLYQLAPIGVPAFTAWCEMTFDGGGWTQILHHDQPDGVAVRTDARVGTPGVGSNKLSSDEANAVRGTSPYTVMARDGNGGVFYRWGANTKAFNWSTLDATDAWADSACGSGMTLFTSTDGNSWTNTLRVGAATTVLNKGGYFCFQDSSNFRIRAFIKNETEDQGYDFNNTRNRTSTWWIRAE